ncbi:VanZ family protein [Peribacillus simplex]|uniref:VanZ family protein n=1 Tax=Peribacillus simplex TaxID=1478 RepID=UPI003D9BDDF4
MLSFSGALICVLFYASTVELHQKLTGGRTPLWQDAMLDTFAGLLGIFCFLFFYRWRGVIESEELNSIHII